MPGNIGARIPSPTQMVEIVDEVSRHIRLAFRGGIDIERKHDNSLVTELDKLANRMFHEWAAGYADVDFIGEEGTDPEITKNYVIYVDPLDGTSTFVAGKPEVSVVMTLMRRMGDVWIPETAIIAEPFTGWLWAVRGHGRVQRRGFDMAMPKPINRTLQKEPPFHVSVITWRNVPHNLGAVRNAVEVHPDLHHHGCGNHGINGALIAQGTMHGSVYAGPSAVEATAITLMTLASGGRVTDLYGKPFENFKLGKDATGKPDFLLPRGIIAASCPQLSDTLVGIVKANNPTPGL